MTPLVALITAPTIDYRALAPILIVLGAAVLSVLVEAFVPRATRRPLQLALTFGSLVLALFGVVANYSDKVLAQTAGTAISIDGVGTFLQGLILLAAAVGALYIAEQQVDPQGDGFAPQASALPGSEDEIAFTREGWYQNEVWSLFLFPSAACCCSRCRTTC